MAIALVLLNHLTGFGGPTLLDKWLQHVLWWGWIGVDLFFVLSGYLITGILLDTRSGPHYFRNFYARRAVRIFPLYFGILLISVFVLPRFLPPEKAARFGAIGSDVDYYFLYLQNFAIAKAGAPRHAILDITWSLAIEEQFYLVWPCLVYLLKPATLRRICFALFAVSFLARVLARQHFDYTPFGVYVLTPCRLEALAAGAIVAIQHREVGGLAPWRRHAGVVFMTTGAAALGLLGLEAVLGLSLPYEPGFGRVSLFVGFTLIALAFGALLVLVLLRLSSAAPVPIFGWGPLIWLGKYSYGLYLIHLPIRAVIRDRIYGPAYVNPPRRFLQVDGSELPGQLLFYPLALPPILMAAWLVYHCYEKHFLKLKRFF